MDIKRDMHIHSCFSDGELTPEEIVDRWEAEGYKIIAVTDHDGIDGSIASILSIRVFKPLHIPYMFIWQIGMLFISGGKYHPPKASA